MLYNRLNQVRRESALTLSELMVVVLILGIVAAIAVPSFALQRQNNVDSIVRADIASANSAVEAYILKHPSRPIPSGWVKYENGPVVDGQLVSKGMKNLKVSEGTLIEIQGLATPRGAYTIKGTNASGNRSKSGLVYNSTIKGFE